MKKFLYLFLGALLLSSCGVQYKQVPYFQNLSDSGVSSEAIQNATVLRIQEEDILAVTVSSLNVEASAIFNMGTTSSIQGNTTPNTNPAATSNGFKVDQNGEIQLPLVGRVLVSGLTTSEARELIQSKLLPYLKEPVVGLRLINFRVSVLGDVAKPGVYAVQNERISLSEALGMAGDLNITAKRNNVLLVREVRGERKYIRLDLQKKETFSSPYYYLENNDVVYVQPSNAKYASVDATYRNISIILSALSIVALLITQL